MSHLIRRRGREAKKLERTPRLIPPNPPQQWTMTKAVEALSLSVGGSEIPTSTFMRVRGTPLLVIDIMAAGVLEHLDQASKPRILLSFEQTIDHKWKVVKPGDKRPVFLPHHPTTHMLLCLLRQEDRLGGLTAYLHKLHQTLPADEETVNLMDTFLLLRGKRELFFTSLIAKVRSWLTDERGRRWFY